MATLNETIGGTNTDTKPSNLDVGRIFTVERTLDFALTARASADVLQMIQIPKNTLVNHVLIDIETIEDSTLTIDVGDDGDPNGFLAAINAEVLGVSANNGAYSADRLYTTANTIDAVLSAAANAGKIRVIAIMTYLGTRGDAGLTAL